MPKWDGRPVLVRHDSSLLPENVVGVVGRLVLVSGTATISQFCKQQLLQFNRKPDNSGAGAGQTLRRSCLDLRINL